MLELTDFTFNDVSSVDMGVGCANPSDGLFVESFVARKSIIEETVRNRTKPYFQKIQRDPLSFPFKIYFSDGFTDETLRDVKRWLDTDTYEEFYWNDKPDRRYFIIFEDVSELNHNGDGQGFLTFSIRANDAYAYSPEYLDAVIDLSANTSTGYSLSFENKGDEVLMPELQISMIHAGDFEIVNNTNGGISFKFTGLALNENVYIDNENKDIISDIPNTYRYDAFNGNYLELVRGINQLTIYGVCRIQFRYRYKFK